MELFQKQTISFFLALKRNFLPKISCLVVPVTIIYLQPRAPDFAHVYFYKAKNRINYVAVQGRSKAESRTAT